MSDVSDQWYLQYICGNCGVRKTTEAAIAEHVRAVHSPSGIPALRAKVERHRQRASTVLALPTDVVDDLVNVAEAAVKYANYPYVTDPAPSGYRSQLQTALDRLALVREEAL